MPDDNWENLKEIFHAAVALPANERAAFIALSSSGDESLRQSIESLLESHEETNSFLDEPAYEAAAEMLINSARLKDGQLVAHYRIISLLGEGGMGRVYLAEDMKLHRRVCLKFISNRFTSNPEWLRRFELEARAASVLNHPNILTIHEIGEAEGHPFIATEFIEGQTLRERLHTDLSINDALEIAVQIASALVAAHRVNVVHRDIKPENIMIRHDDGLVKVLDFGLAKVAGRDSHNFAAHEDNQNETLPLFETSAGVVMGTVAYMSPEQARGDFVDARADVWGLGVIIYEMISGAPPFVGATSDDVIAAILQKSPAALKKDAFEESARLDGIVQKALARKREQRYQTSQDLLIDLKQARHSLQNEPSILRDKSTDNAHSISSAKWTEPVRTTIRPASSAEYIANQVKARKRGAIALAAIVLLGGVAATISLGWYRLASSHRLNSRSIAAVATMKIKRVTSDGQTTFATISPDGKYLVHVLDNGVQQSLWMRPVTTYSDEKQILPPAHVRYDGITFSPDGDYIYYVASEDNGDATLYQMSVLGGASKKLIVDIDTSVTFSPDGRRIAFDRGYPDQGEDALLVANADGTGERKLAIRKNDYWWPAWSPDGKIIASRATSRGADDTYRTVVAVQVDDGTVKPIGSRRWAGIGEMVWLRDGSGLVMTAREQGSDPHQIWFLSYPGGEAHKITNDLDDYGSISLTADSKDLVAVRSESSSNLWNLPHGETSRAVQLTFTNVDGFKGVSWTPDKHLVYESWAGGNSELWSVGLNGGNPKQLTADSHNAQPVVSPDGQHVVFYSNRKGHNNIWRMDVDGSNLLQLTDGPGEQFADVSLDGKWVVFTSIQGNGTLWKVSIDGGQPVQLTSKLCSQPAISPDGKAIACNYMEAGRWKVAVIPFSGGEPIVMFDSFTHPNWLPFHWTPDGRGLAYIDQRVPSSIWSVPLSGGPCKLMFDFKSGRVFDFAWSRDGSQLAVARGEVSSDVVLISNFASGLGGY